MQATSVNSSGSGSSGGGGLNAGTNSSQLQPLSHSQLGGNNPAGNGIVPPMTSEAEILHEAKMLREHKDRLNSRMKLLEVHNSQLEMQLGKLRQLLNAPGTASSTSSSENNSGVRLPSTL